MSIGEELRRLRLLKGVSIRQVERDTGVSNAYLSQLETGKTDKPSPQVLHKLAEYYETEYVRLMQIAGHLQPKKTGGSQSPVSDLDAALMSANVNPGEREIVLKVIELLRAQRDPDKN